MRSGRRLWLASSVAGGLIVAAAGVSPKDAVSNLSGWADLFGLHEAARWIGQHVPDYWAIIAGLIIFGFSLWMFRTARQPRPAVHNDTETEVIHALYWIVDSSAWMRWQRAQEWAFNRKSLGEWDGIYTALSVFEEKLESGEIKIRGRPTNSSTYETIEPDFWLTACLDLEEDRGQWRVKVRGRDGLDPTVASSIPDYSSLRVKERDVGRFWPKHDRGLEEEILVLSQCA